MRSETVDHFIGQIRDHDTEINLLTSHITIPVVQSLHDLATFDTTVRRRDYSCFVREEGVLLLWSQNTDDLLVHAMNMEDRLVAAVRPSATLC